MIACKENKIYTVDESTKKSYLAQGFTICDDNGNVLERPANATVKYSEYAEVVAENERLRTELKKYKKS